jgi:Ca2+-binding RTX toxin-like protein
VFIGSVAEDIVRNVEGIIGLEGNDVLTGDAAANFFQGWGGNDTLNGAGGNDVTSGGMGDDTHIVGSAGDKVIEFAGEGNDTVRASTSYTL